MYVDINEIIKNCAAFLSKPPEKQEEYYYLLIYDDFNILPLVRQLFPKYAKFQSSI